ncbi:MAG: DUF5667 domain-containing protein [bacterium]
MIEKKINNLKGHLSNVHMSADDKRDVFKRILLVVDKIEAVSSEFHSTPVLSPFSNKLVFDSKMFSSNFASDIFIYFKQRKFVPSLVIVLLLCVTGGFSAAAENALPGDSLYSLKVNVNEQVKGMVAVTPEAKARLAVETTERRLQEAVILSSQGQLTDDKKLIIQDQLSKNATDVKNSVASLVASNNISIAQEVSVNFEASLKTHELILETLTKNANGSSNASTTDSGLNAALASNETSTTTGALPAIVSNQNQIATIEQPIATTLMQDIRQEINSSALVRETLSQKEIVDGSDPVKLAAKIKEVKLKYTDSVNQVKNLTDLSTASKKLFESYLGTASSTVKDAEVALQKNDLTGTIILLQQSIKSLSDSDSLISIELNSGPETRKALELIDINKLINSDLYNSNSASSTSASGAVLGTSTSSVSATSSTSSVSQIVK